MTTYPYISSSQLFSSDNLPRPELLDSIDFQYQGVQVHAYGTLHALTGGTNRSYVKLVNDTIAKAPGLKLGEKGMRAIYKGIDVELDDWIQMPMKDAFRFPLKMLLTPLRIVRLVHMVAKEVFTVEDRFGTGGIRRLQDSGGSAQFHLLSPTERRQLIGLPPPREYLLENLRRREGDGRIAPARIADPDWYWLPLIEHYINAPCRSIHMLEFSVELAKLRGVTEVSIFTGEIHNSDMGWYQAHSESLDGLPAWTLEKVKEIRRLAKDHAHRLSSGKWNPRKAAYAGAMLSGLSIPVFGYITALRWALCKFL